MAARTGIPSLLDESNKICRLLAKYSAIIKALTPGNTTLHDALDDMGVACTALAAALELVRDYGD